MKKLLRNRNFWIIAALVIIIAVMLVVSQRTRNTTPKAVVDGNSDKVSIVMQTAEPTSVLTAAPTEAPTVASTEAPTVAQTTAPTEAPTEVPTEVPTEAPAEELVAVQLMEAAATATDMATATDVATATDAATASDVATATDAATATDMATATDAATATDVSPARAYVVVTAGNESRIFPVMDEEYAFSVVLHQPDGTQTENVIHITTDGVYMEKSTCDNQDCVEQGTVTLDNRTDRALYNMIVCLPNQVMVELYTPEELVALFASNSADAAADSQ